MIGKLLSLPFKIANIPIRALEKSVAFASGQDDIPEPDRILSMPLKKIADAAEEVDR